MVAGFRGRNFDRLVRTWTGGDAAKGKSALFPCALKTLLRVSRAALCHARQTLRRVERAKARLASLVAPAKPYPIVFRHSRALASARLGRGEASGLLSLVGWPAYPRLRLNGLCDARPQSSCARKAGTLSGRPLEREHVVARPALAVVRPGVHELAPPRQRVASAVGLFGLVADDVRQRVLGEFAREMRFVARPIV